MARDVDGVVQRLYADETLDDTVRLVILAALQDGEAGLAARLDKLLGRDGPPAGDAPGGPDLDAPREPAAPAGGPVYLTDITVQGFRGIGPSARLALRPGPGLTVIAGRNGCGKSSFAEALEIALTGRSLRLSERSSAWGGAWRNLDATHPPQIEVGLAQEGTGALTIGAQWSGDAVTAVETWAQRDGERRTPSAAFGWDAALAAHRPLLTYDELGHVFGRPSELFDTLNRALGLDEPDAALKLIEAAAKQARPGGHAREGAAPRPQDRPRRRGRRPGPAGPHRAAASSPRRGRRRDPRPPRRLAGPGDRWPAAAHRAQPAGRAGLAGRRRRDDGGGDGARGRADRAGSVAGRGRGPAPGGAGPPRTARRRIVPGVRGGPAGRGLGRRHPGRPGPHARRRVRRPRRAGQAGRRPARSRHRRPAAALRARRGGRGRRPRRRRRARRPVRAARTLDGARPEQAQGIWTRLRQESDVDITRLRITGTNQRRRVEIDASVDGRTTSGLAVMSQGEAHAMALALFIPRMLVQDSPFGFVVIDDPVQAMDPSKVDGLARVLAEAAQHRQVVVFTHDDRLPEAIERLQLDAQVLMVTRAAGSQVTVGAGSSPATRYLADARAVAKDDRVPGEELAHAVPALCRMAVESISRSVFFDQRIGLGAGRGDVEAAWEKVHDTRGKLALALGRDKEHLNRWLDDRPHRRGAIGTCGRGMHQGLSRDPMGAIRDVERLIEDLETVR